MNPPPSAVRLPVVGRRHLPAFITDLWAEPTAFRTLIAACAAIAAVGLDPHILDPGMPAMRAAIRQDEGMRFAWALPGVVAILTGIVAFVLMGPRDPVGSVWEHADERARDGVEPGEPAVVRAG